jgi:hypothetical protein
MFLSKAEPTRVEGAPPKGRLLTFPTNIRLGWKGLQGTKTLAYYKQEYITPVKSFVEFTPGNSWI